jgi:phosphatidate cytidylyltransferase
MKRVLTALFLIPSALYLVLAAPYPLLLAAAVLVASGCYHEYRGLTAGHGLPSFGPAGYVAGVAVLILPGDLAAFIVLTALLGLSLALFSGDLRTALPRAAVFTFGVLYAFGTWRFAPLLHRLSPYWLLYALAINWFGDVAAFYVGRAIGRRKLAPALSPGKTWEGAMGSLAASALFGGIYAWRLLPELGVPAAVALSLVANAAGQIGDLAESAMKRGGGAKDSGTLLPGHGGILDRLDSSMFTLPVVYAIVSLSRS